MFLKYNIFIYMTVKENIFLTQGKQNGQFISIYFMNIKKYC